MKAIINTNLTKISGIGNNMAEHLIKAGYPEIESLKGKNSDDIYREDCLAQGVEVDRCALYCYRLAVYYADHNGKLPEGKENWWNWKD